MIRLSFLAEQLKNHLTRPFLAAYEPEGEFRLVYYTPDALLTPGSLCMSTMETFLTLPQDVLAFPRLSFLLADCRGSGVKAPAGWNILCTDLPMSALYNRVAALLENYLQIERLFTNALLENIPLQELLFACTRMTGASFYLLTREQRILCRSDNDSIRTLAAADPFLDSFVNRRPGQVIPLDDLTSQPPGSRGYYLSRSENYALLLRTQAVSGDRGFYFCAVTPREASGYDIPDLMEQVCRLIARFPERYIESGNPRFRAFLECFPAQGPFRSQLTDYLAARLPFPLDTYVRFVIARPLRRPCPAISIILQLLEILPDRNVTEFGGDIVMALTAPLASGCELTPAQRNALHCLASQEQLRITCTDTLKGTQYLPRLFHEADWLFGRWDTLPHSELNFHLFAGFRTEYRIHDFILLNRDALQSDSYVNFLCPPMLRLLDDPAFEKEQYLQLLMTYLRSNCSIAQTSKALFLHRNTVTRKLRRIEELLGFSLATNANSMDLYHSCCLVHYHLHWQEYRL